MIQAKGRRKRSGACPFFSLNAWRIWKGWPNMSLERFAKQLKVLAFPTQPLTLPTTDWVEWDTPLKSACRVFEYPS